MVGASSPTFELERLLVNHHREAVRPTDNTLLSPLPERAACAFAADARNRREDIVRKRQRQANASIVQGFSRQLRYLEQRIRHSIGHAAGTGSLVEIHLAHSQGEGG